MFTIVALMIVQAQDVREDAIARLKAAYRELAKYSMPCPKCDGKGKRKYLVGGRSGGSGFNGGGGGKSEFETDVCKECAGHGKAIKKPAGDPAKMSPSDLLKFEADV
jgi:hypothetical protein